MKCAFVSFLLLYGLYGAAQKVPIGDPTDKGSFANIKDKTIRKEITSFTETGEPENTSHLKLGHLPLVKTGNNFLTFQKDSFFVTLTVGKFKKADHKITYQDHFAVRIDNKRIWGTDGELPREQIDSIEVVIGGESVFIPHSAYQDLFEPALEMGSRNSVGMDIYYSHDRQRLYIFMANSDGAGAYEATLIIRNKKYSGRVADSTD